jgi:uncharacterized membrane protein
VLGVVHFYDLAVFAHVAAVVIGFGVTFTYPIFFRHARRTDPRSMPQLLRTIDVIGRAVIGPCALLILISGIYLVGDGPFDWGDTFVSVGLPVIVILILVGPTFFRTRGKKLEAVAQRDIEAAGSGQVQFSEEFDSILGQILTVGYVTDLLVLIALFFMVVKP